MRRTRVIHSDNGTLLDYSDDLNRYAVGTAAFPFVSGEDYLYIGNIAPFNHLFIKLATANAQNVSTSVEYWTGDDWESVVELRDSTDGLTQDGFVEWVPDRDSTWVREDTDEGVTGLTSATIYDKYWVRLSYSGDLDAGTILSFVGHKFSDDFDIEAEYPDLMRSNVLSAFSSGGAKTDWEEQHIKAAEIIIEDLISKQVIRSKNQILERNTYRNVSVQKVAEIIYSTFGDDFVDQAASARREYSSRLNKSIYDVDKNSDGDLATNEMISRSGFMTR